MVCSTEKKKECLYCHLQITLSQQMSIDLSALSAQAAVVIEILPAPGGITPKVPPSWCAECKFNKGGYQVPYPTSTIERELAVCNCIYHQVTQAGIL